MSDKQMGVKLGSLYSDHAVHRNMNNELGIPKKRLDEHFETSLDSFDNSITHPALNALEHSQSDYDKMSHRLTIDDSDLADDSTSAARLSSSSLLSMTSASTSSFYPTPPSVSNTCDNDIRCARDEYNSQRIRNETSDTSPGMLTGNIKYTAVQNRLRELCAAVEDKDRLLKSTKNKLAEKDIEIGKLHEKIRVYETNFERLKPVIESLRDDAKQNESKLQEVMNDRDGLLVRNASLSRQIEYEEREWSIERERLSIELDDVIRELEVQKMILNGESISEIVQRWQNKVFELEGMIADRDRAIRAQQQRISKLKQSATRDFASSNESLVSLPKVGTGISMAHLKRTLLLFFTSTDEEQLHQLRSLSDMLLLTEDEERQIWENVKLKLHNT